MCLTSCYFLLGGIVKCISYTRTCQTNVSWWFVVSKRCVLIVFYPTLSYLSRTSETNVSWLFVILFQSNMWNKCVLIVWYPIEVEHGKQMCPDCLLCYKIIFNIILCVWHHVTSFWEVSSNAYLTLEHVNICVLMVCYCSLSYFSQWCETNMSRLFVISNMANKCFLIVC